MKGLALQRMENMVCGLQQEGGEVKRGQREVGAGCSGSNDKGDPEVASWDSKL